MYSPKPPSNKHVSQSFQQSPSITPNQILSSPSSSGKSLSIAINQPVTSLSISPSGKSGVLAAYSFHLNHFKSNECVEREDCTLSI